MNKKTAPARGRRKIPFRWVEEKGFKVTPVVRQAAVNPLPANHTLFVSAKESGAARKPSRLAADP